VCQRRQKDGTKEKIFSNGISVGYTDDLNGLNGFDVERLPLGGSMKFLTTFVGRVFPLSGRKIRTFTAKTPRTQRAFGHGITQIHTDRTTRSLRSLDARRSQRKNLESLHGTSLEGTSSKLVLSSSDAPFQPPPFSVGSSHLREGF
jgi:hypothetical protein